MSVKDITHIALNTLGVDTFRNWKIDCFFRCFAYFIKDELFVYLFFNFKIFQNNQLVIMAAQYNETKKKILAEKKFDIYHMTKTNCTSIYHHFVRILFHLLRFLSFSLRSECRASKINAKNAKLDATAMETNKHSTSIRIQTLNREHLMSISLVLRFRCICRSIFYIFFVLILLIV